MPDVQADAEHDRIIHQPFGQNATELGAANQHVVRPFQRDPASHRQQGLDGIGYRDRRHEADLMRPPGRNAGPQQE